MVVQKRPFKLVTLDKLSTRDFPFWVHTTRVAYAETRPAINMTTNKDFCGTPT